MTLALTAGSLRFGDEVGLINHAWVGSHRYQSTEGRIYFEVGESQLSLEQGAKEHTIPLGKDRYGIILLASDGSAKVSDFGIATATDLSTMTRIGAVMGTPCGTLPILVANVTKPMLIR